MSQLISKYIGALPYPTIYSTILKLAPFCQECGEPMLHICLEECCSVHSLFCYSCNRGDHLCHLTNDLSALFTDNQNVPDPDSHDKQTLTNMVKVLRSAQSFSDKLVETAKALSLQFSKTIAEIEAMLSTF